MEAHPRRQCKKVSAAELASGQWPFGLSWSLSFVGPNKTSSTGFFNLGAWGWRLQHGRLGPLLDQALQDFSHFVFFFFILFIYFFICGGFCHTLK